MVKGFLSDILRLNKTVFTFQDLTLRWKKAEIKTIKSRITYYIKHNDLYRIRRGLYAKDKNYDRFELANKIFTPSYISFETVLKSAGMIFQYYNSIFVASYLSRTIECDGTTYSYRRIHPDILVNAKGVEIKENYSIATAERAFLDMLYIHKNYHFDNVASLDWDKVHDILPIYHNKRMEKVVAEHYREAMQDLKE